MLRLRFILLIHLMMLLALGGMPITAQRDADTSCVPATGEPIRLGMIFPENTFFSVRTGQHAQGAEAMLSAINACGGVDGRPVEVISMPAADRADAEAAATQLIDDEAVTLVIGSGVPAVHAGLVEVVNARSVVLWEVTQPITARPDAWAFTPRATTEQLGTFTVDFVQAEVVPLLDGAPIRAALIYENSTRGAGIAAGVRAALPEPPIIEVDYEDTLRNSFTLGDQLRDQDINTVIMAGFDDDIERLWFGAREANANVTAWINIGSTGFQRDLCQRIGNNEQIISVTPVGPVSEAYIEATDPDIYAAYRREHLRLFNERTSTRADLSASGVYLLLRYVLPQVEGPYTAENIRTAIIEADVATETGFLGEGLSMLETGANQRAAAVVQQRQNGAFCSVWPGAIATCLSDTQPMPTWRDRAIMEETMTCSDPA